MEVLRRWHDFMFISPPTMHVFKLTKLGRILAGSANMNYMFAPCDEEE